jgi:hypothetical protein
MEELSLIRVALTSLIAPIAGAAVVWPIVGAEAAAYAALIAYGVNATIGMPLAIRLIERDRTIRAFLLSGAAIGAAPFLLADLYLFCRDVLARPDAGLVAIGLSIAHFAPSVRDAARWAAAGALCGAVTALGLWFGLARRQSRTIGA